MQKHQFITGENRQEIKHFIRDMTAKALSLPTYEGSDHPRDDDGTGSYLERSICTGVTLVMDWEYLDAPSTYLVIKSDVAPSYERDCKRLCDVSQLYDDISMDLSRLLDCGPIEYDHGNSNDTMDIWHIHGDAPY